MGAIAASWMYHGFRPGSSVCYRRAHFQHKSKASLFVMRRLLESADECIHRNSDASRGAFSDLGRPPRQSRRPPYLPKVPGCTSSLPADHHCFACARRGGDHFWSICEVRLASPLNIPVNYPFQRRVTSVLHLDPIDRSAAAVRTIAALGRQAL
jgi:hypothetical protein